MFALSAGPVQISSSFHPLKSVTNLGSKCNQTRPLMECKIRIGIENSTANVSNLASKLNLSQHKLLKNSTDAKRK